MSTDYSQQVADILDALGDSPTPDEAYHATRNYDERYVAAALTSLVTAAPGGGSQSFVTATLRHSADFTNLIGNAPVVALGTVQPWTAITLPPSLFADNSLIATQLYNDTAASVKVGAHLVVQNAAGTAWIEQDTAADQTIAAGTDAAIDFATNAGSSGAGLSWNSVSKQIDIASAGVYSAFVLLYALPV